MPRGRVSKRRHERRLAGEGWGRGADGYADGAHPIRLAWLAQREPPQQDLGFLPRRRERPRGLSVECVA